MAPVFVFVSGGGGGASRSLAARPMRRRRRRRTSLERLAPHFELVAEKSLPVCCVGQHSAPYLEGEGGEAEEAEADEKREEKIQLQVRDVHA